MGDIGSLFALIMNLLQFIEENKGWFAAQFLTVATYVLHVNWKRIGPVSKSVFSFWGTIGGVKGACMFAWCGCQTQLDSNSSVNLNSSSVRIEYTPEQLADMENPKIKFAMRDLETISAVTQTPVENQKAPSPVAPVVQPVTVLQPVEETTKKAV